MAEKVYISIECEECDGEGIIEIGPECSRPASLCCGGCYREERCEECNGEGKIEAELDSDEVQEIIESILMEGASIQYSREFIKSIIKNQN